MNKETLEKATKISREIDNLNEHLNAVKHKCFVNHTEDNFDPSTTLGIITSIGQTLPLRKAFIHGGIKRFVELYKQNIQNEIDKLSKEFNEL